MNACINELVQNGINKCMKECKNECTKKRNAYMNE